MVAFDWTGSGAIALYVLGVLVLVGTFIGQQHAAWNWLRRTRVAQDDAAAEPDAAPDVDVRILDITPTGGGGDYVDFRAELVNYGIRGTRATVAAEVEGQPVRCTPATFDLLVNHPPDSLRIDVPRPALGDLIAEFNHETTLYGKTLKLEASVEGDVLASREWREHVYTAEENAERAAIQQRKWRLGRGEETPDDRRLEHIRERGLRRDQGRGDDDLYVEL